MVFGREKSDSTEATDRRRGKEMSVGGGESREFVLIYCSATMGVAKGREKCTHSDGLVESWNAQVDSVLFG